MQLNVIRFQTYKINLISKLVLSLLWVCMIVPKLSAQNIDPVKKDIDLMLTTWHLAAADADFDTYFNHMTEDAVFIGTDATENWTVDEFKAYSKPYFDKGKAWSFTTLERTIFIDPQLPGIGWFDELLDTQMGICRGSGVVKRVDSQWKVQHYVLSIAVPNEFVSQLTKMKNDWDQSQINEIRNKM